LYFLRFGVRPGSAEGRQARWRKKMLDTDDGNL